MVDIGLQAARILVIDDDPYIRKLLQHQLGKAGHIVIQAEGAEEGLKLIESEPIDVILLDLEMPVLDGVHVLRTLRERNMLDRTPVVVLSAHNELDTVTHCIELGADDFLVKPWNQTLLGSRIKSSVEKKRYRDGERRQHTDEKDQLATKLGTLAAKIKQVEAKLDEEMLIRQRLEWELKDLNRQKSEAEDVLAEIKE